MATKQRGSAWSIKLVLNLYKLFGYDFIYYLMYPVTFFYFIFASNVKSSLKIYYKNINQPFNNWVYFKHLRMFAICMVDRFISRFNPEIYDFNYIEKEKVRSKLEAGSLLVFSHFGGWASASNATPIKNKVNIVMQEALMDGIKEIEESLEIKKKNLNVIDLNKGGVYVSLEIAKALRNKEVVGIMGDRSNDKKYDYFIDFFAKKAGFNKNPFQIAYKLNQPIMVFFIANVGKRKYVVSHKVINLDTSLTQEESISLGIKDYVSEYEEVIKRYPNQWFNFYNFWENE